VSAVGSTRRVVPRLCTALLASMLATALGGCGADASAVYDDSAAKVLQGALSDARTAEMGARLWVDGQGTHGFAAVVVADSDAGVDGEAAWFEAQQPPTRRSDGVRAETVAALDAASSAVQDLRIALGRGDRDATRAALADLHAACAGLESLSQDLR